MRRSAIALLVLTGAACSSRPQPEPATNANLLRGEQLYQSACSACHTEQAHWRERRLVRDWPGLVHQVTRWQQIVGGHWEPQEVRDVAEYLNRRYYRLP
jgi:hypothetical protein